MKTTPTSTDALNNEGGFSKDRVSGEAGPCAGTQAEARGAEDTAGYGSWSAVLKTYEGVARTMVESGLCVAEDSVANAGNLLRHLGAASGIKAAEVSLNGAGDVLSEVSKSLGRIRDVLVHGHAQRRS